MFAVLNIQDKIISNNIWVLISLDIKINEIKNKTKNG